MKLIRNPLTGKISVKYQCPYCKANLTSKSSDINTQDLCPECNRPFIVPGEKEFERYQAKEQALAEEKKKQQEEQQAARQRAQEEEEKQRKAQIQATRQRLLKAQSTPRESLDFKDPFPESDLKVHQFPVMGIATKFYETMAIVVVICCSIIGLGIFGNAFALAQIHAGYFVLGMLILIIHVIFSVYLWITTRIIPELIRVIRLIERSSQVTAASTLQLMKQQSEQAVEARLIVEESEE